MITVPFSAKGQTTPLEDAINKAQSDLKRGEQLENLGREKEALQIYNNLGYSQVSPTSNTNGMVSPTINARPTATSSRTLGSGSAAGNFGSCVGGGAIANYVKGKISSMIGSALDPTRVPTSNAVIEGKETGAIAGVSWDQMGWCLVNGLIESIGAATVNWINHGFQGNPAFVEDPAAFFAGVADAQAGLFLNDISNGYLCSPVKTIVRVNLANSYNSRISPYAPRCSFSGISSSLDQFMSGQGQFNWIDWSSYTQNPYNNPVGATAYGQIELNKRIARSLGTQSTLLQWGRGFLSKTDPETGKITSPGSVIETQVNERLFSGQRRLEIADEFDEVVTALVNQLIKMAVSEMTQRN